MVRTLALSLPRAGVQSLVGELRSHKPSSVGKKKSQPWLSQEEKGQASGGKYSTDVNLEKMFSFCLNNIP